MNSKPLVTIIMPIYNEEKYVHYAIDSILTQTFSDFELILVDDGSTDNTRSFLTDYARRDARVVLVENDHNRGLVYSLNRGLALASGKYIARMDANDISLPDRLALQVGYLEQHAEVGVLGTNIVFIDGDGRVLYQGRPKDPRPVSPSVIRWMLLWRCPIYHTTVMMRRAVLEETGFAYDPDFRHAEDRELWTRLIKHTVIASLQQVLVLCRVIPTSVSAVFKQEQRAMDHVITRREVTALLGTISSDAALETLISVFSKHAQSIGRDFVGASDILIEAYRRFDELTLEQTDREEIRLDVASRLIAIADEAAQYSSTAAVSVLWNLRYVLSRRVLALGTTKRVLRVLLRLALIHPSARLYFQ